MAKTRKDRKRQALAPDAHDPQVNRTGSGPQGSKKGKKGYDRKRDKDAASDD